MCDSDIENVKGHHIISQKGQFVSRESDVRRLYIKAQNLNLAEVPGGATHKLLARGT